MCGIAEEAQATEWSRIVCNQPTVARYVIVQVQNRYFELQNINLQLKIHISVLLIAHISIQKVAKTVEVFNAYEVEVYGKPGETA